MKRQATENTDSPSAKRVKVAERETKAEDELYNIIAKGNTEEIDSIFTQSPYCDRIFYFWYKALKQVALASSETSILTFNHLCKLADVCCGNDKCDTCQTVSSEFSRVPSKHRTLAVTHIFLMMIFKGDEDILLGDKMQTLYSLEHYTLDINAGRIAPLDFMVTLSRIPLMELAERYHPETRGRVLLLTCIRADVETLIQFYTRFPLSPPPCIALVYALIFGDSKDIADDYGAITSCLDFLCRKGLKFDPYIVHLATRQGANRVAKYMITNDFIYMPEKVAKHLASYKQWYLMEYVARTAKKKSKEFRIATASIPGPYSDPIYQLFGVPPNHKESFKDFTTTVEDMFYTKSIINNAMISWTNTFEGILLKNQLGELDDMKTDEDLPLHTQTVCIDDDSDE